MWWRRMELRLMLRTMSLRRYHHGGIRRVIEESFAAMIVVAAVIQGITIQRRLGGISTSFRRVFAADARG